MGDADVVEFYRCLSDADTGVPVVANNIPAFTSGISLKAFSEIIRFDRITALKNSGGNLNEIMHEMDIRDRTRPDFRVLTGSDESIFAETRAGCDGSFTGGGYVLCDLIAAIYSNDPEKARRAEYGVLPLIRLANEFTFPYGYKLLGAANGFDFGAPRQIVTEDMRRRTPEALTKMRELIRLARESL